MIDGYERHFGCKITVGEMDRMFSNIDIDGNGSIDYSEFLMATMNTKNALSEEKLKQAFMMFDADSNGTISAKEI